MDPILKRITDSTKYIRQVLKENSFKPRIAIVLGSGLGSLADSIADAVKIPYTDIPGFPVSTTIGHQGNLILGRLGGKDIIAMQGRVHFYEGLSMSEVTMPVRVFKSLGVKYLLVSNAAGGINFDYRIGDLVVIKDHINMIPNPLLGPNLDKFGPRFPDMTHPYDPGLRAKAMEIASKLGIKLREGVYIAVTGPSYETPAEWNFFRMVGAPRGYMTILFSHATFCIPYVILSVRPRVNKNTDRLYEAALDLGASEGYAFRRIVLPELKPGIMSGFLLSFTMSVDDFIITYFTRGAGINTISTLIYSEVKIGIRPSLFALSTIIFVVALVVLLFVNLRQDKADRETALQAL